MFQSIRQRDDARKRDPDGQRRRGIRLRETRSWLRPDSFIAVPG